MSASLRALGCVAGLLVVGVPEVRGHDGPPFPIVSDQPAGAYLVSVWTDPDATDDGTAGGQFWVQLRMAAAATALPPTTRARISVRPVIQTAPVQAATAAPVAGNPSNQFAAVLMDHEGRFAVEVTIDGPEGQAVVRAEVDATYDMRPPPFMLAVYAVPFLLAGFLWVKLILRRSQPR
jgi:hypothetical protein